MLGVCVSASDISDEFAMVARAIATDPGAFVPDSVTALRARRVERHSNGQHRIAAAEHEDLMALRTGFGVTVDRLRTMRSGERHGLQSLP